jgi:hypothetical protein
METIEKQAELKRRLECYRNHILDKNANGKVVRVPDPTDITKESISPVDILKIIDELKKIDGNGGSDFDLSGVYGFDVPALRERSEIRLMQI